MSETCLCEMLVGLLFQLSACGRWEPNSERKRWTSLTVNFKCIERWRSGWPEVVKCEEVARYDFFIYKFYVFRCFAIKCPVFLVVYSSFCCFLFWWFLVLLSDLKLSFLRQFFSQFIINKKKNENHLAMLTLLMFFQFFAISKLRILSNSALLCVLSFFLSFYGFSKIIVWISYQTSHSFQKKHVRNWTATAVDISLVI